MLACSDLNYFVEACYIGRALVPLPESVKVQYHMILGYLTSRGSFRFGKGGPITNTVVNVFC